MTAEEFYKYHWKGMEVVEVRFERRFITVQCCILSIDFEAHVFKLIPVDGLGYESKEFWMSREFVDKIVKNQKLKIHKK